MVCLGALWGEHSLKVARSARDVRAQCKDSPIQLPDSLDVVAMEGMADHATSAKSQVRMHPHGTPPQWLR